MTRARAIHGTTLTTARLSGLSINPGDLVRLQVDADDTASYYVVDVVDLEQVPSPLAAPAGARTVLSYGAVGNGVTDDTLAISNCVVAGPGIVWVRPATTCSVVTSLCPAV